jgi:hypothetical protein
MSMKSKIISSMENPLLSGLMVVSKSKFGMPRFLVGSESIPKLENMHFPE